MTTSNPDPDTGSARTTSLFNLCRCCATLVAILLCSAIARGDVGDEALSAYLLEHDSMALKLAGPGAESGNFMAQYVLGRIYEEGKAGKHKKQDGAKWLQIAASQAQRKAADGDPRGQYLLGRFYYSGGTLPKNTGLAVSLFRRSAEKGNSAAQNSLGWMLTDGEGVAKNLEEAASWFHKAAEQGNAPAQKRLGVVYSKGIGVSKDLKKAFAWYFKAAKQGYVPAQIVLSNMYVTGLGVARDEKLAFDWISKAVEQEDDVAQFILGVFYANGISVSADKQKAITYYLKSAEQGNADAQTALGEAYESGSGVPKNYSHALTWYRKAAEQGEARAQLHLGAMYNNGQGVPADTKEAIVWLRKAAEQGDSEAQHWLEELSFPRKLKRFIGGAVSSLMMGKSSVSGNQGSKEKEAIQQAKLNCEKTTDCLCTFTKDADLGVHVRIDGGSTSSACLYRLFSGPMGGGDHERRGLPRLWAGAYGYGFMANHREYKLNYDWGPVLYPEDGITVPGIDPKTIKDIQINVYEERSLDEKLDKYGKQTSPAKEMRRLRRQVVLLPGNAGKFNWSDGRIYGEHWNTFDNGRENYRRNQREGAYDEVWRNIELETNAAKRDRRMTGPWEESPYPPSASAYKVNLSNYW